MENKEDVIEKAVSRKVGDAHPNGKWIWTEYKPGKFDWRSLDRKLSYVDSCKNFHKAS